MSRRPRIQPTFRLSGEGLGRVLGDLERVIMETLWRLDRPSTVAEVQKAMPEEEPRAYHTVTTVMTRLCDKGLLRREKQNAVWHYSPVLTQEEFRRRVAQEVLRGIYELAPEAVINSMLDVVVNASGREGLDELARLVDEKKRERGQ
jgi:predicted transcriptional regulator